MGDSRDASGGTRTCPKCGETKPTLAFSRSSRTKHGFQSRCKECRKADARAGYAKNIEKQRDAGREKQATRYRDARNYTTVTCLDCGASWDKWVPSLPEWRGRCNSCAQKLVAADPGVKRDRAERALRTLASLPGGRIPDSKPWGTERPNRGAAHPRWKGGITDANKRERSSSRYVEWRTSVYQRDHYTCQTCGQVGGKLNAHHVNPWADHPESRYDIDNGVTLCKPCHSELHAEEAGRRLGEARDRAREKKKAATPARSAAAQRSS